MKKILVTTDFSASSKAGLRFAIQLAEQTQAELVFFHCFQALIPTTIKRERIEDALSEQGDEYLLKLEHFVRKIHKAMDGTAEKHRCVVVESLDPVAAILDYANKHGFHYICMCTQGAGAMRKVIGTMTASVMQKSTIPVLVVPHTYRVKPIQKILYASDMENFDKEMALVAAFATSAKATTDVAHFYFPGKISLDRQSLEQMWRVKYPQLGQVFLQQFNLDKKFPAQLEPVTKKAKPSLLVFFTHPKRTWFDKFFANSVSESVSYVTKLPMLIYRK